MARRRFQLALHDTHENHLRAIEHLMKFDKYSRSKEITMIFLAGYQVLYGNANHAIPPSMSSVLEEHDNLMRMLVHTRLGGQALDGSSRPNPVPSSVPEASASSEAGKPATAAPEQAPEKQSPAPAFERAGSKHPNLDNDAGLKPGAGSIEKEKKVETFAEEDLVDENPADIYSDSDSLEDEPLDPLTLL